MPCINHSPRDLSTICKPDGTLLYGELDMYKRIESDCNNSSLEWHMFYDLNFSFRDGTAKSEIQIDFLLVCNKGAIVLEVKGGGVVIKNGVYYYSEQGVDTPMKRKPFDQANHYKWQLFNHHVFNINEIYVDSACAFPHAKMEHTSINPSDDLKWKLWTRDEHDDPNVSFADFCESILDEKNKKTGKVPSDLSKNQLDSIINRLAPSFFYSSNYSYSESSIEEILSWLQVRDLETLESLSPNDRIFIEGGPGTGKTTIAKGYIKKYSQQHGLYLCWNKLLHARIKKVLKDEGLNNCEVMQYESFLMRLPNNTFNHDDFQGNPAVLVEKIKSYIAQNKDSGLPLYDYIIVDEAHDILDKGILAILDGMCSIRRTGLTDGRFLVFFDNEQGYDSESRLLNEYAREASCFAAKFLLLDNKRVQTNREIVSIAEKVKDSQTFSDIEPILSDIQAKKDYPISVHHFSSAMELLQYVKDFTEERHNKQEGKNYTILAHSSMRYLTGIGKMGMYDVISKFKYVSELTVDNVNLGSPDIVQFSTILSFKGLENHHIVLIIKKEEYLKCFELYIGMTRAIVSLNLLILD